MVDASVKFYWDQKKDNDKNNFFGDGWLLDGWVGVMPVVRIVCCGWMDRWV